MWGQQVNLDKDSESTDFLIEENKINEFAIIGIASTLPFSDDTNELWEILRIGKECITDFHQSRRKDIDDYLNFLGRSKEKIEYIKGGYLKEIDKFDYKFFRISPKEAVLMNPAQRIFLQTVYEAIQNAGYGGDKIIGTNTGVYVGYIGDTEGYKYKQMVSDIDGSANSLSVTGNLPSVLSGRISYLLDLKGPSMTVDLACSSSLVAVHMACQSLKLQDCDMAIVGGICLHFMPLTGEDKLGIESSDGRTRPFDSESDGTGIGEGSVAILIKPLDKAIRDKDNIHAVIKGSAVNQDGSSAGLTAPNVLAQADVISKAIENSGVDPETITYIEAHGTGTKLGDPVEIEGIRRAFQRYTDKNQFCAIGSIKANIGHLYEASGIAGLLKAVLSLKNKVLLPQINFKFPNKEINFIDSPVYVNTELEEWNTEGFPRRCGVSSFGFSGTNCHVILEEYQNGQESRDVYEGDLPFTLSAMNISNLINYAGKMLKYIKGMSDSSLADICYTMCTGRWHLPVRLAFRISSVNELEGKLEWFVSKCSSGILNEECLSDIRQNGFYIGIPEDGNSECNKTWEELYNLSPGDLLSPDNLNKVMEHYVEGAVIPWETLFGFIECSVSELPVYPFEKHRCWPEIQEPGSEFKGCSIALKGGQDRDYSKTEVDTSQIVGDVLGFKEIDINSTFYSMGADSISLMKICERLKKEFNKELSLMDLATHNSVYLLSKHLDSLEKCQESIEYSKFTGSNYTSEGPFTLSEVQSAYLMGRESRFELGNVCTHVYMEIDTELDLNELNNAVNKCIERHEMLRTVFLPDGTQETLKNIPVYQMSIMDVSDCSKEKQEETAASIRSEMSHHVFDPYQWPLFEFRGLVLGNGKNILFINIDMLIADGTSLVMIAKEIFIYYQNPDLKLPEMTYTFKEYMNSYTEFKQSDIYNKAKEYWMARLDDIPASPSLPLKDSPSNIEKPVFKRKRIVLEKEKWIMLKQKAMEKSITPSALLLSAYAKVLSYWSGQDRFTVNLTVFNRYPFNEEVGKIIGDFTSIILVDIDYDLKKDFWENATEVQVKMLEGLENRHFDGVNVISELSRRNNSVGKAIMPVVFTSMLFGESWDAWSSFGELREGISQTSQVYLDFQAAELNGGLMVNWDYVEQLFSSNLIDTMFDQYCFILEGLLDNNSALRLKPSAADMEFIGKYNSTEKTMELVPLHMLFVRQAQLHPENIALEYYDMVMSYKELDEESNRVGNYLKQKGIGKGSYVGVLAERCMESIVSVLGILKAGAAYVPIDPGYPEERRSYILENSNCEILITKEYYKNGIFSGQPCSMPLTETSLDDVAYIIYTSGSTGRPKGVIITHGACCNTIKDINEMIDNKSTDKIIGLSSMCFDLSVYDIFGQLGAGGTLVIIDDQRDSRDIIDVINSKKITVWNSVPAIMGMTLEQLEEDFCNLHLRAVLLSGDWIPINMPEKIFRHFPNARVISLGGATEASIWSIYFDVKEVKKTWKSIPYGIPLKNQSFYVLHKDMSFCPVNVPGELFIGGIGVAKGYMNDEEKTNSSFVFHDELGYIYKTGDYGVLRDEGFIEFLGRKDHQIKIKGYRIELGEIEARLLECSSIQKALVIDKTDQKGNKYLCAYIVYNENVQHVNIREFLASKLPAYMIPSYFIRLDNIPLTANGKVDRKSLPEPSEKDVQQTNYQVQTSDYIEEGVYTIWKDVLKQDEFELDQDFFEIGGDSLQIQRVIGQVEKKFKIRLPMREVFIASTVKKLSEKIRTQLGIQNQVKDFEKVDSEKLYYLSPLANWEYTGGRYSISGVLLDGITADGFIHLLSSLKKGITIPQLQNMLASFHLKDSINTVKKMKDHQVLVEDIISLNKLFKLQDTLYKNKYGEELLVNKEKYYQYKKEVHSRDFAGTSLEEFDITADTHLPAYMTERKTWRSFDRSKIIDFNTFCRFLSVLCQKADNNGVASYYYASAGGLYPIDVYIYVKKNRVESLDEGIYYLNPRKRVLKLIKKNPEIDERCYYFRNKEIFAESAFSVFLVYRPDANMPVYKHMGNMFALIDTGIIVATITLSGEITGLGTCSIGDMDFDEINRQLMLSGSEMVVHAVEVGLRNLEEVNSSNFPDLSMAEPVSYCEMEVSSEQKRLYAIQISNPQSTTYNYPMAFEIKGNFHHQKLKNAIEEVAKRHEALRTAFVVSEKGHILQRIYNNIDVQIEIKDLNTQNANEALQGLIRPFDMEKPPLFRVCVLRESDDKSYLFMDFHHIIGDGSSQAIFINELTSYYNGYQVETEVSKYTNYCRWQKEFLLSDDFIKSQSYWMDKLKGYRRSDGLKTDFPRKPIYDYEGDELCLLIEGSLSNEAKNLAKMYGTSYFNLLLAVYYILLHKHTGENDIIVGFPAAARPNEEFFSCIGMFANTLALRSTINKEQKFNSYLNDVREITIGAIENQFYPFEKLVEMLAEERQPGRNPIFDTVFVLQNTHHQELELNGSEVKQIELKRGIAHFDIVFQAFEDSTGTSLRIEYATSLFFRETIERLGEFYITILKQVVANPEIRIKDIVLVSESEKNMILENFINMDGEDYEF